MMILRKVYENKRKVWWKKFMPYFIIMPNHEIAF